MPKVEFHFDFGSPNAYLAHLVIPEIEQRTGTKFEYVPVLLGGVYKLTGNRSPAENLVGIKNKPDYERLETARFIKRHGITCFRHNPFFPVNTLTIMRGAIAAQKMGVFERYVDEIYRHMWSVPKKLDDPAVLRAALLEFWFRFRAFRCAGPGRRGQGAAARQYAALRRVRHLRLAHLLRRRRDLLRQRQVARRRGNDSGHTLDCCIGFGVIARTESNLRRRRALLGSTLHRRSAPRNEPPNLGNRRHPADWPKRSG